MDPLLQSREQTPEYGMETSAPADRKKFQNLTNRFARPNTGTLSTLSCRDLNASCSGCLPEFFLGFFKFQCMLLEKKLYLIDFSFKFNAIKFGNLLMNWFTQEKMFTYCCNKFRPLNHMHYVKCSVNSLLLT